jgi:4-hydroxy-3-polyprenylbenzoate decarboxylase
MMFRALRAMGVPGIVDVAVLPEGGANFIVVVAAHATYKGQARQVIHAACTQEPVGAKWIIVVDGDVNPHDWNEVTWCLWSRVQPQRDLFVTSDREVGNYLDPSVDPSQRGYTSKVCIDATTVFKGFDFPPLAEPSAALKERVKSRWREYGLP